MRTKYIIALGFILVFGIIRWPLESALSSDFKAQGFIEKPINITTREKLGQTGAFVALGGLRSMIASMLNIRAHVFFTDQRWFDLEETYKLTTTLQPQNIYYWDSGSWHLAYNASAHYKQDKTIPPAIRRIKERDYIKKGTAFLEDGIRLNPDNLFLKGQMAFLLTDQYKIQDFPRAAKFYKEIADAPRATNLSKRKYLYTLCRIPGKEQEAYELAKSLYEAADQNRTMTMRVLLFVFQNFLKIPENEAYSMRELLGPPQEAYRQLNLHYARRKQGWPVYGVASAIRKIEASVKPFGPDNPTPNTQRIPSSIAR